jgi:hemoglobin/transferrin/lactoferrin receptor protein
MYLVTPTLRRAPLALAIAIALTGQQAVAQEHSSSHTIEEVTIVGSATNAVVTTEEIEQYQANDLADVFRLIPSISVGGSAGIAQKIYVRGLEDSKINVTVDGAPQTSTLFHHIGRVTIDPDLLSEVEVQAGAGEATSGAGAIGGAIRFKTKDINDLLQDDAQFGGKLKLNAFSNNDGKQYSVNLYGRLSKSWGAVAYFKELDTDNMEDGDGNEILATAAEQKMAFVKFSGEIGEHQALSLSYEGRDEEGEFSATPNWFVAEDAPLYPSEAQRDTFTVNYNLQTGDALNLEATAYQTESSYRGGRFDWLAEIKTFGFDIRNTSVLGMHRITYGADYRDDQVDSGYAISQPEEDHGEEGSVTGVYAQVHSQVTDVLLLSYGLRYDDYQYEQKILLDDYYGDPITEAPAEISHSEVSINAGLAYDITDELTFGLGYAEAARGKEVGDGFTLDGYLYDGSADAVVDTDLEAEKVKNIEASVEYTLDNFQAKIAVYQSKIDDVIYERQYGNSYYENIGTVEASGFEFDIVYSWDSVEVFLGYSKTDTELNPAAGIYTTSFSSVPLNGYEFKGLGNSRGDSWNLGANYSVSSDLKFGLNVAQVSSLVIDTLHQDVDLAWVSELYELNKPAYTVVDIFAEWTVIDSIELNLAVTNLFNEQYRDHSSVGDYSAVSGYEVVVGPWEAGRDIRLSASYSF